jgi:hypothetical protein
MNKTNFDETKCKNLIEDLAIETGISDFNELEIFLEDATSMKMASDRIWVESINKEHICSVEIDADNNDIKFDYDIVYSTADYILNRIGDKEKEELIEKHLGAAFGVKNDDILIESLWQKNRPDYDYIVIMYLLITSIKKNDTLLHLVDEVYGANY